MNAFSEKSDLVLRTVSFNGISVNDFTVKTNIGQNDAVVTFLKNAGFLLESDFNFLLTEKGKYFLSTTSFVEQRNQRLSEYPVSDGVESFPSQVEP